MQTTLSNISPNKFEHIQTAHCENGVVTSLLRYHGLDFMTEPLAFGIGAGLFYIHMPFLKINHGPAISFRIMPGFVFRDTCKALGVRVKRKKFRSAAAAQSFLDERVDEGTLVGCQVGVFHLKYFPREYRFHFNAHNIIVYGRDEENYLISDPVMETTTTLTAAELEDVRFARGPLAPKGHIYYPTDIPKIDRATLQNAIRKGIKRTAWWMSQVPIERIGSSGFRHTAKKIRKWRGQLGEKQAGLYLGQIVRMQEEIGTGGGGFRFLYAAFLEQAAAILENDKLLQFSNQMTQSGDLLRENAVRMAAIYRGRRTAQKDFDEVADAMNEVADLEVQLFKELHKLKL